MPDAVDLREFAFHRLDDQTFRAVNHVIRGQTEEAAALLAAPFTWRSLVAAPARRKLRVLLLRTFMRWALRLGAAGPLRGFVQWSEYGRVQAASAS